MPELQLSSTLVISLTDVITALIVVAIIGGFKYGFKQLFSFLPKLFISLRRKQLIKIKKMRTNRYEVQRQIAKESAYFTVFLASGAVSLGLAMLVIGSMPSNTQLLAMTVVMAPVLLVELFWLKQQAYVLELTKLASRLSPNFKPLRSSLQVPAFRVRLQRARRNASSE
tara:strand:- start:1358 stop:1864 length:507 start_codon:yes stop_codon:yes gene_type:complete